MKKMTQMSNWLFTATVFLLPSLTLAHEKPLCPSSWGYRVSNHDMNGDGIQEEIVKSRRKTLNLADGSGLSTKTVEHRVKAVAADGSVSFKSPWLVVNSPRIFDPADGQLGYPFAALGDNGLLECENRTVATYDDGTGAKPWLVYTAGFFVRDYDSDIDVSRIRVWIIDSNGVVQNKFSIDGVPDWRLSSWRLRLADFDGDGNDDLAVTRFRPDAPGVYELKTKVFDLIDSTLVRTFRTSYVIENTNLNP